MLIPLMICFCELNDIIVSERHEAVFLSALLALVCQSDYKMSDKFVIVSQ